MKKFVCFLLAGVLLLQLGCGSSKTTYYSDSGISVTCSSGNEYQTQIFAMDTFMTITAYGKSAQEAIVEAAEEIFRLESILSVTDKNSEVFSINESEAAVSPISSEVFELCSFALELSELSDGAFDISVYPLVSEWGFTSDSFNVPKSETIADLLPLVDYSSITLTDTTISLSKGMKIDFGALAKGYASQRISEIFEEHGISSAVISLGGNVQVTGSKTDGNNWTIAIQDPVDKNAYAGILSLSDKAIVTSGGYQRCFEENGTVYHHIIDPSTGYPADSGLLSVTVICDNGLLADGLSTTLFVLGEDAAVDYWRNFGGFDMVLITDDGRLLMTGGVSECFSASDNTDYAVEVIK